MKLLAKQLLFLQNTEYYSALDHFKQNIIPPAQYLKVCEGGCTYTTFSLIVIAQPQAVQDAIPFKHPGSSEEELYAQLDKQKLEKIPIKEMR